MLNTNLIYLSPSGGTKKVAELIEKNLNSYSKVSHTNLFGKSFQEIEDFNFEQIKDVDMIGVGTPVYEFHMLKPIKLFLKGIPEVNNGKEKRPKVFLFATYGNVSSGKTLLNIAKILNNKNYQLIGALKLVAPHFYEESDYFPEQKIVDLVSQFVQLLENRVKNPPEWEEMKKNLNYQKRLIKLLNPLVKSPFSNAVFTKIKINHELCNECALCVKNCPTGAIDLNTGPSINKDCIKCYNCVKVCPTGAISSKLDKLKKRISKLQDLFHETPENEIY
ncbi:MAG: hypothetical protein GF383_08190 [Candidatus Lokiarchaeota archaeon]|nr:hypothetical protein [Candidatus Lokiarchaeota archaeon]MBD3340322.1 hypothetical protein [Candidatus Lokiarchaeota archaeon]